MAHVIGIAMVEEVSSILSEYAEGLICHAMS
jgi:hypothetical protein